MSNSVQNRKVTSLTIHDSLLEHSIIANLPDSPPQPTNSQQHKHPIQHNQQRQQREYGRQPLEREGSYPQLKTEPFSFRQIEREGQLRQENQQQKLIIKQLSQQLRSKKNYQVSLQQDNQSLAAQNQQLRRKLQANSRLTHSKVSQFETLEQEKLSLRLLEKTKQYEQLYLKFQSVENELVATQEINSELQRQRKFLAERLSEIEIHTEGQEVVGELENKLVLMSTELMRLGNLSRSKTQENKQLTLRLKESILKREHLEKDLIERQKLILTYKEDLRMLQVRAEGREGKDATHQLAEKLRDAEITNAILEEKQARLLKENEDLERENKELSHARQRNSSAHTKALNLEAQISYFKEANSSLKEECRRYEAKLNQQRYDTQTLIEEREQDRLNTQRLQEKLRLAQQQLRKTQVHLQQTNAQLREHNHSAEQRLLLKTSQARRLQERVDSLQREVQRSSDLTSQAQIDQLLKEVQRLEGVQLSLKMQLSTYEEKLVMLAQENQRLNLLINSHQQAKATADKLRGEAEHRERRLRQLQKELENVSNRQHNQRQDNEALRGRIREFLLHQQKLESLQFSNRQLRDELEVLKTQLSLKEQEVWAANQRYQRQSAQLQVLPRNQQQIVLPDNASDRTTLHLETELERLRGEVRGREEQAWKLEEELRAKEQVYSAFSLEIERLNIVLEQRAREAVGYRKEIDLLQHKVATCEEALSSKSALLIASQNNIAEAEIKSKSELNEGRIRALEAELEGLRGRCEVFRRDQLVAQGRVAQAQAERGLLEQRAQELEYQLSQKTNSFKQVQESFKLTISQMRSSNTRLEQAVANIQHHYIVKLEQKERQSEESRAVLQAAQQRLATAEGRLAAVEAQLIEKEQLISTLSSKQGHKRDEAEIASMQADFQLKITLLTHELQRTAAAKQQSEEDVQRLSKELRDSEARASEALKENSSTIHTIDLLSNEIQRLNTVLVDNIQIMRESSKKNSQLELQCSRLRQQYDYLQANTQLSLQQAQDKRRQAEQDLQHENEELQRTTQQLQRISQQLQQSMERQRQGDELNRELKYQLQEKSKDAESFLERVKALERQDEAKVRASQQMQQLRESNQQLERRVAMITREYEQLVVQFEQKKRPSSSEADEKMRIISSYETTIKQLHSDNSHLTQQNAKNKQDSQRLNALAHQLQQRTKIAEERARVLDEKSKRAEERSRTLEYRLKTIEETGKGQRTQLQGKMMAAMEELGRLQVILKAKQTELDRLQNQPISSSDSMRDKKGIFIIKQANEIDQRSRSASGNAQHTQPLPRHPQADLLHRYQLLETVNKKLSVESETLRKKNVEYQFKMLKLKEEFDLINRLIHEYREENDHLKESNKLLTLQTQRTYPNPNIHHSPHLSPQHSSIVRPAIQTLRHYSPASREESVQSRTKLGQEIDRLNKINNALQSEIHDLRLNASDNIALRRRLEENLSLIVILFAEVESLRMRLKQDKRSVLSPLKPA